MHLTKINRCIYSVIFPTALFIAQPVGAALLDGTSANVSAGNAKDSWQLINGAKLNVGEGAETDYISAMNSSVTLNGSRVVTNSAGGRTAVSILDNSIANITDSRIENSGGLATSVGLSLQRNSTTNISGSSIQTSGRGVLLNGGASLTMTNTQVNADLATTGNPANLGLEGIALSALEGTAIITDSKLTGVNHAVDIIGERQASIEYRSHLMFSNSELSSTDGAVIQVRKLDDRFQAPITEIELNDGTVVNAGNGILMSVLQGAEASLSISNSHISGDIISDALSTALVSLKQNASLTGAINGVTSMSTTSGSVWNITSDSNAETLTNGGTVAFTTGLAGRTLTVGNYVGNDGLLVFNSVLGGDDSITDKLVVTGDTQGTSKVAVNNLGGSGASTVEGIELISVGGVSAGEFSQQGRIVAGAYDYQLIRGNGSNAANWYLSSSRPVDPVDPTDPTNPVDPTDPTNPIDPVDPTDPTNPIDPVDPITPPEEIQVLRPEAGAYASNLAAANTMFALSLNSRLGETEYTDAITGEKKLTSMWMHVSGGHNRVHDNSGQLSTQANRYVTMLGGDFATGTGNNGSAWRLGGLAGYGNSRSNTNSNITGYRAKGEVDGYTTGLYGTWYANGTDENGLYVDSVLQYSWFDNTVSGEDIASESYNSKGFSTSVESGYVFALSHSFFLQPKAQLAWSGIRADDHTEVNGTRVSGSGNDNLRSSLGLKAFMKGNSALDNGKERSFKPFVEVNWIHNTKNYGVLMDDVNVSQAGTRNIAEAKMGVEGRITPQLNLTGSVAQQIGDNSWSDTAGMLGIKYSF